MGVTFGKGAGEGVHLGVTFGKGAGEGVYLPVPLGKPFPYRSEIFCRLHSHCNGSAEGRRRLVESHSDLI